MPVDRGAAGDDRQRRALQGLASSTGFIVGPGLVFNDDATELSVSLSQPPTDPSPGLRLYDTGLGLLLSPLSALRTRADGVYLISLNRRGGAHQLVLRQNTGGKRWGIESATVYLEPAGPRR